MATSVPDGADPKRDASRLSMIRAVVLVVVLLTAGATAWIVGSPDVAQLQARVDATGLWAPVVFVGFYAVWSLLPVPKAVLTAGAGALFGFLAGAALAWLGAMLGALAAFGVARWLGRESVDALLRGRLRQVDTTLNERGFLAVLTVRLVPVLPFTVINYGAGVTGVGLRDYAIGSALGMLPGTLSYAAIGAFGTTRPWAVWLAVGVLVVLVVLGAGLTRRRASRRGPSPTAPVPP